MYKAHSLLLYINPCLRMNYEFGELLLTTDQSQVLNLTQFQLFSTGDGNGENSKIIVMTILKIISSRMTRGKLV